MRVHWYALAALLLWIIQPLAPSTHMRIDEWQTPSRASAVEDVAPATDGSVWYTAPQAGKIGRLDPSTGKFREFALPAANSNPHMLARDRYGNVWFTVKGVSGAGSGHIGMLDPNSGEVKQFDLPPTNTGDPEALVFDQRGTLWFTVSVADAIGMLDPQTGHITLTPAPAATALPECIAVNSRGAPFFSLSGSKIGSLDPATMKVSEYALPAGARAQCLAAAKDGTIYYTDFPRGYLGHVAPAAAQVDEVSAPGGPKSEPFAIATTSDGSIWFVETADEAHNVLVRFTPDSKKMEPFPLPGQWGKVHHIAVGPRNELWLAEGASGKLARVSWR